MEPQIFAYLMASLALDLLVLASMMRVAWTRRGQILEKLRQFLRSLAAPWWDPEVSEGIFEFRCGVADRMLTFYLTIAVASSTTVQLNLLQDGHGFVSEWQRWIMLILSVGCLTCKMGRERLKQQRWRRHAEYWMVSLCGLVYLCRWSVTPQDFSFFSLVAVTLFRLPAVFLASSFWEVVGTNLLFFAQAFWRTSTEDFPELNVLQTAMFAVRAEILILLTVMLFNIIVNRILQTKAELEVDRRNLATQLSAASSLLRLTCDAVIELDSEMRVQEDSPELACMLMKSGPGSTMKGANFLEFMVPDDAERARSFLGLCQVPQSEGECSSPGSIPSTATPPHVVKPSESITARAFHTRLVDSYNTKICIEVFQVKYSKLDGQTCNLLGLRDFTDVKSLAPNAMDASASASLPRTPIVDPEEDLPLQLPIPRTPSDRSPESAGGDEEDSGPGPKKEMYLDIDMEGLLVHAASLPLAQCVGKSLREVFPSPHTSLLLQSLHSEAKFSANSFNRHLNFKDLPLSNLRAAKSATGTMQVIKTRYDQIHVLMSFRKVVPGARRGGTGSAALRSTNSRSFQKRSTISSL